MGWLLSLYPTSQVKQRSAVAQLLSPPGSALASTFFTGSVSTQLMLAALAFKAGAPLGARGLLVTRTMSIS